MKEFLQIDRPHVALITNHGYGGVFIPIGGAPDTGGQNVYVNSYAKALDNLGYKVTIYTRGGFPFYNSERLREGEEFLTPNVRYIYAPGGGDEFLPKEDISVALIDEINWIYDHIDQEARSQGVFPWEYFKMINSHYWDAGVIAVSIIVKWQNDLTSRMIELLTEGIIDEASFANFHKERHFHSISKAPAYSLGKILMDHISEEPYIYQEEIMKKSFTTWCEESNLAQQISANLGGHLDWHHLRSTIAAATKELRPLVLSKVLGLAILDQQIHPAIFEHPEFRKYRTYDELETFYEILKNSLRRINRHIWTPHSLGVIKEWNFKQKSGNVKHTLRFRERRSHERMVCDYTKAFGATSYEIAESLVANYGVQIDDVLFFPPGVDMSIYHKYPDKDIRFLHVYLSRKTGLTIEELESKKIILEASRMDLTKRKDVIIDAFRKVVQAGHDDCILLIVGGPSNEVFLSLKSQLESYPELKDKAFLTGFVEDEYIPLLFDRCDMYVSASEMEGFGMSVSQAAINAKAIVSSDKIPFCSYYIGDDAFILPAGDIDRFAEAMIHLLTNEDDRKERGEKIKKNSSGLMWENLIRKFLHDLNLKEFDIPLRQEVFK